MQRRRIARQPEKVRPNLIFAGIGHNVSRIPVLIHNVQVLEGMLGDEVDKDVVVLCETGRLWRSPAPLDMRRGDRKPLSFPNLVQFPDRILIPRPGSYSLVGQVFTNGRNILVPVRFIEQGDRLPTDLELLQELCG